ncbi:MAG: hypothetical protein ABFS46_17265, partial [Myxococcota bacterium]
MAKAKNKNIDKVMQLIEKELKINPKATAKELQEKAKAISASVGKLSVRQFHAKYPLQVRRKLAPTGHPNGNKSLGAPRTTRTTVLASTKPAW